MRRLVKPLSPTVVLVALCGLGSAQQLLESRTILATITGTRNRPLVDLGVDDFVVDERGKPREVLTVNVADYPVVVLVDNSRLAADQFEAIRAAAARFIRRLGDRPVAIGAVADPAALAASFDLDRASALDVLARLGPTNDTPLPVRAAATAATAIRQTAAAFSAIVVVSAGLSDEADPGNGDFLATVLESRAAVHVVTLRPVGSEGLPINNVLRGLAEQTHGEFTTIYSTASIAVALDRLADRMATEMMIQYVVPRGAAAAGDVRVGVKIPGARVRGLGVR